MNRFGPGARGRLEHPFLAEVALGRRPWPNQVRLVCGSSVQRAAVGLRVHSDGSDPELPQGAKDANGDLTAVGNEDFREHGHSRIFSSSPGLLVAPRCLVFAVEILGDPLVSPAAFVSRGHLLRLEQPLERELNGFPFVGIRLGLDDELHRKSLKALACEADREDVPASSAVRLRKSQQSTALPAGI